MTTHRNTSSPGPAGDLADVMYRTVAKLSDSGHAPAGLRLERSPKAEFGDYSSNAAMVAAKLLGCRPRQAAERIAREAADELGPLLERYEIAGPGFVNLFLSDEWHVRALGSIVEAGERFGSGAGRDLKVNLEFVSANPTGPLHIGHARHAAYGDSLARTLRFAGYDVTREFYINDYGRQIAKFGESISARLGQARGESVEVPEGGYAGEYVKEIAASLEHVDSRDVVTLARSGVEKCIETNAASLGRFRVEFDVWSRESALHEAGTVEAVLATLAGRGLTYEADGALWLRTTDFGDDKDRVLRRSNGDLTYFAADTAYHGRKLAAGYDRLIDVLGADHHGYVGRLRAATVALGSSPETLEVLIVQLVHLVDEGKRVQMSKRTGEFVTLDDLLSDIGVDAARFFLLQRSHETPIDLDLGLAREQSRKNPVYYVQYAHARIASIVRKANAPGADEAHGGQVPRHVLHASERRLVGTLAEFPSTVDDAARTRGPHVFTDYTVRLASDFTAFYRDCRVVGSEPGAQAFRLTLCSAVQTVLRRGLHLLGVDAPDRM